MKLIRRGSSGEEVKELQILLSKFGYEVAADGIFGRETEVAVREFQRSVRISCDGIVGSSTWHHLRDEDILDLISIKMTEEDYVRGSKQLKVDIATVKAVEEVETGGRGGFFKSGFPSILFEGHIFWQQLRKLGMNPEQFVKGNENILYSKWTKSEYYGGIREYERLEKAKKISRIAAYSSTSWGSFQIMGFNYADAGCSTLDEFVAKMHKNEGSQFDLFIQFIKNKKLDICLQEQNWKEFARRYNGPSYEQNKYDVKLEMAYKKYSCY